MPVHHLRSHIAANYITFPDLEPPFLCLVVSGGHSHIIEVKSWTDLHVIGRTRDDAAGEAFDKAARAMGMPLPRRRGDGPCGGNGKRQSFLAAAPLGGTARPTISAFPA